MSSPTPDASNRGAPPHKLANPTLYAATAAEVAHHIEASSKHKGGMNSYLESLIAPNDPKYIEEDVVYKLWIMGKYRTDLEVDVLYQVLEEKAEQKRMGEREREQAREEWMVEVVSGVVVLVGALMALLWGR